MIYIKEDKPIELSGTSSLFISFNYNQKVIDFLKTLDIYRYHKDKKIWELPITDLAHILDNLTYLDDINISLLNNEDHCLNRIKPTLNYKTKPYEHQLTAIEYGLNHDKWLLLDVPGLGKTLITIYIAEELYRMNKIKHCLVICGVNSLKNNWVKEIKEHSKLSYKVLGEKISKKGRISYSSIPERAKELKSEIEEFFIITNIESFTETRVEKRDKKGNVRLNKKGKPIYESTYLLSDAFKDSKTPIDMILLDEAHKIKDPTSSRCKALLELDAKYKIAMTGTLLINNPLDAYTPLKWTDNEKSNYYTFKNQYCVYGGFNNSQIIGFKNLKMLKSIIDSCSLRRTKDIIADLPPKTIIPEYIELEENHSKFYEAIENGVKEEADKVDLNSNNLLAMTTRLRQATSCPSILTSENIESTKIKRAVDLATQIISNGDKVVIFSAFIPTANEVAKQLTEYKPLLCTGETNDSEFNRNKELFQTDDNYKLLVGTYQKCGTGHTLNAATYMICIDSSWTKAQNDQTEDRIHRVNNTKPVFIYYLIAKNTIDEHVWETAQDKGLVADYMIDDKISARLIDRLKNIINEL